jgi:hypothetical protein
LQLGELFSLSAELHAGLHFSCAGTSTSDRAKFFGRRKGTARPRRTGRGPWDDGRCPNGVRTRSLWGLALLRGWWCIRLSIRESNGSFRFGLGPRALALQVAWRFRGVALDPEAVG